jgi:hypothetical protein
MCPTLRGCNVTSIICGPTLQLHKAYILVFSLENDCFCHYYFYFDYWLVVFNFQFCSLVKWKFEIYGDGLGWSGHPVCGKRYHFIIKADGSSIGGYHKPCMCCGDILHLSESKLVPYPTHPPISLFFDSRKLPFLVCIF